MRNYTLKDITFIVIGRNEASNLNKCFESIKKVSSNIIFVDSNSEDESIAIAKKHGILKIGKLTSNHYSASLARYVGAELVDTDLIQFIDGDMSMAAEWPQKAVKFLNNNILAAVVHGFKREHKNNYEDYTIKSDKIDHRSDYLQGSFCIVRDVYVATGGLDYRFIGEEERDLYIRIHDLGYEVWYHHSLMSSHYDFKKRGIKYLFFTDISALIWLPLIKSILNGKLMSYLFVYRRMILFLPVEIASIVLFFYGIFSNALLYVMCAIAIQIGALIYAKVISRIGYFIIWKSALINIFRVPRMFRNKVNYTLKII